MRISRREFVGAAAVCAAKAPARQPECRVVDLGPACILRESLAGFCGMGIPACSSCDSQACIVPGAGTLPEQLVRQLAALVRGGGWVIFESAAGFGGFDGQRRQLAEHFGLELEPPSALPERRIPYVDYGWPARVKIRDFSRIVPVRAAPSEVIASIAGQPVAARLGTFVFLGSPVGPALLAGDREAHLWFSHLIGRTGTNYNKA